jgi:alpha-tubulin suppressor-like RCC1 family protein
MSRPTRSPSQVATRRQLARRRRSLRVESLERRELLATVTGASFLPTGQLPEGTTSLTLTFSEPINGGNVPPFYSLQRAGTDGVVGTLDDIVISLAAPMYVAANAVNLSFSSLPKDAYRLTVRDLINSGGVALDGDNNGVPGGNYVREFLVGGEVETWGRNDQGQLGDGATFNRTSPVAVNGLSNVVSVSAGDSHMLALRADGTVWSWGMNSSGQLGDGTTTSRNTPTQVVGITNAIAISAGRLHSLALLSDGTVKSWGANSNLQLGDGTSANRSSPVTVSGLANVTQIQAGFEHSLALLADGTVRGWGDNFYGQLGVGHTVDLASPAAVSGLTNVTRIAGGWFHTLALRGDGTVRAWGLNDYGQLGDGTTTPRATPVSVTSLTGVSDVQAGGNHSLALLTAGTVKTWGLNDNGQLGDGTTTFRVSPTTVSGLSGVASIEAGRNHSLARLSSGSVRAWGDNFYGQLGDGTTSDRLAPVAVGNTNNGVQISGGGYSSVVRRSITKVDLPTVEFSAPSQSTLESVADDYPKLLVKGNVVGSQQLLVSISGGSATHGSDFTLSATVVIPARTYDGTTSSAISVPLAILNDSIIESTETIELTLLNPTFGIAIGDADNSGGTNVQQTVSILDDEFPPTDIQLTQNTINEDAVVGTTIGLLESSDLNLGDSFTYELIAVDGDIGDFVIVGDELQIAAPLDYESAASRQLLIRSTDASGLSFEKWLSVNITDANEPPFNIHLDNSTISENAGMCVFVGFLSTEDPDFSFFPMFNYGLAPGLGDDDNSLFYIAGDQLWTADSLDFEASPTRTVRINSTDVGGLSYERSFVITVLNVNEAPTSLTLNNAAISENAGANASVGAFSTTDPDAGDAFTYSLVTGDGDADNSLFQIVGGQLQAVGSLDFEAAPTRTVRVRSTDAGGLFVEQAFVITVQNINEAPTALTLNNAAINEKAGANASVGSFSTTDPDAGDAFSYSLVSGAGDADNSLFQIAGGQLQAIGSLDFEAAPTRTVRVRSTDAGGLFVEQSFVITVLNVNEAPTAVTLNNAAISENAGANASVGSFSTTDPDAGDAFTYSLVTGAGDADNSLFQIVGGQLQAVGSLDFEAAPTRTVRVRSTDAGGLFVEQAFVITVNDILEGGVQLSGGPGNDRFTVVYSNTEFTVDWSADGGPVTHFGPYGVGTALAINGLGGADHLTLALTPRQIADLTTADITTLKAYLASPTGQSLAFDVPTSSPFAATDFESADFAVHDDSVVASIAACFANITNESQIQAGTDGPDTLTGTSAADLIFGGDGDDHISGLDGADCLWGGAGQDALLGGAMDDRLEGGSGNDSLIGDLGFDWLRGGLGNDSLDGGLHDDQLDGGPDVDTILGGPGYDIVRVRYDEAAYDSVNGGDNTDSFLADAAAPVVLAGFNAAAGAMEGWIGNGQPIFGTESNDFFTFQITSSYSLSMSGVPYIDGRGGDDILYGTNGVDVLRGGEGNDTLLGFGGVDTLYGDAGNDSLNGGAGIDHLYGGDGVDTLTGGDGRDIHYFSGDLATLDTITDFALYSDTINLQAYALSYSQVSFTIVSPNTTINLSNGKKIRLNSWNRAVGSSQFKF